MSNFHGRIMNIPSKGGRGDYYEGHRDARHAAAEIALEADALAARLAEAERDAEGYRYLRALRTDTDITTRLRKGFGGLVPTVCDEAANVIETLRLKLRAADNGEPRRDLYAEIGEGFDAIVSSRETIPATIRPTPDFSEAADSAPAEFGNATKGKQFPDCKT